MKSAKSNAMLEEISQEPELFRAVLRDQANISADFVKLFQQKPIKRIYFSGCGSPSNNCIILKYAATKWLHVDATYSFPGLFNNHEGFNVGNNFKPEEMLLICPAESGNTKGPVLAAREAHKLGISVACCTLNPTGILARESDVVLHKLSGEEVALPSTKGHLLGLFMFLLCILDASHALKRIDDNQYEQILTGLQRLPLSCADAQEKALLWFAEHQDMVMNASGFKLIAYGANYATAIETTLKFVESHRKQTAAYELEEFMHGPIRSLMPNEVIFLFAAEDCVEKERLFRLYRTLKEKGVPNCILVQSSKDIVTDDQALAFDAVNMDILSTVEYLVPMQVLSYLISDHLGLDMSLRYTLSLKEAMEPSFLEK